MNFIHANRACTILYHFLTNSEQKGKWIIPSNICHYVPSTVLKSKHQLVFYDVNKKDYCLDKNKILEDIAKKPEDFAGIIFVETYGKDNYPLAFYKKLKQLKPTFLIIHDSCLSIPSFELRSEYSDLDLYSTGYSKYVDLGTGGYGISKNEIVFPSSGLAFEEKEYESFDVYFRKIIFDNQKPAHINEKIQSNWLDFRSAENSSLAYRQLIKEKLIKVNRTKNELNEIYRTIIPLEAQFPIGFQNWRFNIIVNNKQQLLATLSQHNLFASSHYKAIHYLFDQSVKCPNAIKLHDKVINLFNDFRYDAAKASQTAELVKAHITKFGLAKLELS